jgi:putative ABC transport system permease protein
MKLFEALRVALSSLLANRLRSILATLGIMIGIAAVSTLLSVGQSFQRFVNGQLAGLDTTTITLQAQPDFQQGEGAPDPQLTDADIAAIRALPSVERVVPRYSNGGALRSGAMSTFADIIGADAGYAEEAALALGRAFAQREVDERARVALVSWELAQQLFPDGRPIGRTVDVLGLRFVVVGVLSPDSVGFFQNPSNVVVPLSTARDRLFPESALGAVQITDATITPSNPQQIEQTEQAITQLLRERHKLRPEDGNDFSFRNFREFADANNRILTGITAFLGVIGGIALLVGGIGITNIMLVSVTERTQEIGLRKAVGARRRDIMVQFLIEAVVLSVLGGLAGILTTAVLVQLGAVAIQAFAGAAGNDLAQSLTMDLGAMALALAFASFVGVVAGSYPAFRASRLSPITALRNVG